MKAPVFVTVDMLRALVSQMILLAEQVGKDVAVLRKEQETKLAELEAKITALENSNG